MSISDGVFKHFLLKLVLFILNYSICFNVFLI